MNFERTSREERGSSPIKHFSCSNIYFAMEWWVKGGRGGEAVWVEACWEILQQKMGGGLSGNGNEDFNDVMIPIRIACCRKPS